MVGELEGNGEREEDMVGVMGCGCATDAPGDCESK